MAALILQTPQSGYLSRLLESFNLSEMQKRVIKLRYGIDTVPRTLEQIHRELGLSIAQIGEIESGVMRTLRHLH